jgi:hypothetical protein
MNLKALWREPSTKRGVVMFITGGAVLYQAVFGSGEIDVVGMESRIERWIGIGMMLAGLLGWLPDTPKEKSDEKTQTLPPIEFVGRSEADDSARQTNPPAVPRYRRYRDPDDDGMPKPQPAGVQPDGQNESGWNN